MAIRASMHEVGAMLLGQLLEGDSGYRGAHVACQRGHQAAFGEYRAKSLRTVLGPLQIRRAYYYCPSCREGVIPRDRELDITATSFSPGVRRLMGRLGSKEAFEEARGDLEALAGITVQTKQVERVSETIGEQIEAVSRKERRAAVAGKVVLLHPIPRMYVAVDGTGVPMVPRETHNRPAKDATGPAKTREAKLGCVFTQTSIDEEGRPVRDEASTTYVGAIESGEDFGRRIFTEAVRRGSRRAHEIVLLGDGAPWIWSLAEEHFPGAIQIVDLYHAREHLGELAKVLYGPGTPKATAWATLRIADLDAGDVPKLISKMTRLRPATPVQRDALRRSIAYFQVNAARMCYADFRRQGLFVGSGVIEAGCKTIAGRRLKQSGMRWTVRGANAIIALRCCLLSGRWESFWEARSA